ncbi:MAG: hypothetical protein EA369_06420 [Bradymonadales bacterium]|nr:MAG: hypothetical protein EA369_06420 [Bradymonadales bacterium]
MFLEALHSLWSDQVEWALWIFLWLLGNTLALYLGLQSNSLAERFRKVPILDFWVAVFVWLPPLFSALYMGIAGFLVSVVTQSIYLAIFCRIHSWLAYLRSGSQGGRLLKVLGSSVGTVKVLAGFYFTLLALPCFLVVRFGQIFLYPLLQFSLGFPRYIHSDFIQVSRHKFQGLVGIDLLWCLYCEWAAGVYSLGGEMVRNNESFWCPIRFYENKHCENCRVDFPDLAEWIPSDGKMEAVENLLQKKYPKDRKVRAWYQHPSRRA